jgi:uncharacterized membrane protein YqjE
MEEKQDAEISDEQSIKLLGFPGQLLWFVIGYGGVLIPIYHILHFLHDGHSLLHVEQFYRQNFIRSFLYEETVVIVVSVVAFTLSRRLVRPLLFKLKGVTGKRMKHRSFMTMLTLMFSGLLLMTMFMILWYVLVGIILKQSISLFVLCVLVLIDLLFVFAIYWLLTSEYRRELLLMIASIRGLIGADRGRLHSPMPILSNDEVGQLTVMYNLLQQRIDREYDQVAKEMKQTSLLQRQLLTAQQHRFGSSTVASMCEPSREVRSSLYDVISLDDGAFAVAVAATEGPAGMPAALLMSATLLLVRTELREGGSPGEVLTRLNLALTQMIPPGDAGIGMALLVADPHRGTLACAAAGHAEVLLTKGSEVTEAVWTEPANALGTGLDRRYSTQHIPWSPGYRIQLCVGAAVARPLHAGMDFTMAAIQWEEELYNRSEYAHV